MSRPLNIAFVSPEYITEPSFDGGLANYLHRTSIALIKMGHSVTIFVSSLTNEHLEKDGINVHRVSVMRVPLFIKWLLTKSTHEFAWESWTLNRSINKQHNNKPFDLVQYASYKAVGFCRNKNIPSIVRVSSFEPMWRMAYGSNKPSNYQIEFEKLEKKSLLKADAVFGPSSFLSKIISNAVNIPVNVIRTPFYIEINSYDTKIADTLSSFPYLLFFGTLGLLKGTITIAKIVSRLLKDNPSLRFVFIGKDTQYQGLSVVQYLKKKAYPFQDRIIWHNKLNHNILYPIIKGSLAVVLPSRIDNFPNTCLEAMAHKKIVIATKKASFEELIEHKINGLLCNKDDPADLLRIIKLFLNLPDQNRKTIEENAYKSILALSPEKILPELISFYYQTIEKYYKN